MRKLVAEMADTMLLFHTNASVRADRLPRSSTYLTNYYTQFLTLKLKGVAELIRKTCIHKLASSKSTNSGDREHKERCAAEKFGQERLC
jgi:hypothetical protein